MTNNQESAGARHRKGCEDAGEVIESLKKLGNRKGVMKLKCAMEMKMR